MLLKFLIRAFFAGGYVPTCPLSQWQKIQWERIKTLLHRVRRSGRCERLEPDAGKLARPVLRGRGDGNIALLPDFGMSQVRCCHLLRQNSL